jgi:DNA end-binding protein Ku
LRRISSRGRLRSWWGSRESAICAALVISPSGSRTWADFRADWLNFAQFSKGGCADYGGEVSTTIASLICLLAPAGVASVAHPGAGKTAAVACRFPFTIHGRSNSGRLGAAAPVGLPKDGLVMASRSVWSGYIRFSLVTVPVKAYTAAATGGGEISLNQLHKDCNSRIQYKKTCPLHGEVKQDDIVSGYEYDKNQYVVIDPEEIEKMRTPADKSINVQAFVAPEQFDARYFNGKHYFLLPDGPVGQRSYALLLKAMVETDKYAFAQVVFSGKEQVVLVRPMNNLLVMSMLSYEQEMKGLAEFEGEAPKAEVAPAEVGIAKTLIATMTPDEFDYSQYRNGYTHKLTALIEAKM